MTAELLRVADGEALHASAAELFVAAARDAVASRGVFTVVLSGGTTPQGLYRRLADDQSLRSQVAWHKVRFFWGDERRVPPGHPDSNFRMVRQALLDPLSIDPEQVWRIKGECGDADEAAAEYERDLQSIGRSIAGRNAEPPPMPRFDLVLLGMGADGHTASLFPWTSALHEQRRLVIANLVPQLATERITLTTPVLNHAAEVLFLVHGEDKAEALQAVIEGPYDPERRPAQLIRPVHGRLRWLVDLSAASRLSTA